MISIVSKGFPYKDQIKELFIVMVSFCVFPTSNIFNFPVNLIFSLLNSMIYSPFCDESAVKSQSVDASFPYVFYE